MPDPPCFDDHPPKDPKFWRTVGWLALPVSVLVFCVFIEWSIERWQFNECRKSNTLAYCGWQHPLGAHR